MEAAVLTAYSNVAGGMVTSSGRCRQSHNLSPWGADTDSGKAACTKAWASTNNQTSACGSCSNSLTINLSRLAVVAQWMRFNESPGIYSRTPAAYGVTSRVLKCKARPPGSVPEGAGKDCKSTKNGVTSR